MNTNGFVGLRRSGFFVAGWRGGFGDRLAIFLAFWKRAANEREFTQIKEGWGSGFSPE